MRKEWMIALFVPLASCSRSLGAEADVSAFKGGERLILARSERALLAEGMRRLVQSCSLNSLDHPEIVSGPDEARWKEIESRSHLYARFDEPFEVPSNSEPTRLVSEVLVGFENPYLIGPELTRHGGTIVAYEKCDGRLSLELMCAGPLNPYLSSEQKSNCERLAAWVRESDPAAEDLALQAIAAGREILASSIDASQSREPMEAWLRWLIPADAAIRWEANDCGEGADLPVGSDTPICAELRAEWGPDRVVSFLFSVGTEKKGISGTPALFWAYIEDGATLQELTSLRDARARLRELSSR